MKLVAKGAGNSFETHRIGVTHAPLDQRTIDLLANYTKTLAIEEQWAVMDALNEMESGGSLAKAKLLLLPCISNPNTLSEAMINAVDPLFVSHSTPDPLYYEIRNGGIVKHTETADAAGALNVDLTGFGLSSHNFSMFYRPMENITGGRDFPVLYRNGAYNVRHGFDTVRPFMPSSFFQIGNVELKDLFPSNAYMGADALPKLFGWSIVDDSGITVYAADVKSSKVWTSTPALGSTTGVTNLAYAFNQYMEKPQGVIFIGEGLTDAEEASLNTAIENLLTALGYTI